MDAAKLSADEQGGAWREELRATLREAGNWVEDVETYVSLIRSDLLELRDLHRDTIHG